MATIQGITGGLSGKMGSAVFRQRFGETVVSQYQPKVSNPNTTAQSDNRAAFKLISQLGAALADVIAIPRNGAQSPRNIFTKVNYPLITKTTVGGEDVASIEMEAIQLTDSSRAFPYTIQADLETADNTIALDLVERIPVINGKPEIDEVVFVAVSGFGTLGTTKRPPRVRGSVVGTVQSNGSISVEDISIGQPLSIDEKVYVYAYGISYAEGGSSEDYENITTANDVALLVSSRSTALADLILTETVATTATTNS